jgi:hypothetical protein
MEFLRDGTRGAGPAAHIDSQIVLQNPNSPGNGAARASVPNLVAERL